MAEEGSTIQVDIRRAFVGGIVAALITLAGSWGVGRLSEVEARILVENTLPRMQAFCNTVILAAGTILALMLTVLGMSMNTSSELRPDHYRRIRQIALLDTILLVGATVIVLVFNVPFTEESSNVPTTWFRSLYYGILVSTSLVGGMLVSVVLMIHHTVSDIIDVAGLGRTDKAVVASDDSPEPSEIEE